MSARLTRLAVAALVLASPVASFADANTAAAAMDECVQVFLSSDLAKDRKVTVQKIADSRRSPLALSGRYKIEVIAKGRESGKQVAHIVCYADQNDTIIAVNGRPTAAAASLASSR